MPFKTASVFDIYGNLPPALKILENLSMLESTILTNNFSASFNCSWSILTSVTDFISAI